MNQHDERRRFRRIAFDAPMELRQGERAWPVKLLDLSLKGLLVERPAGWDAEPGKPFDAIIHLDLHRQVAMQVELRHQEATRLGFVCKHIDIDSLTHLHRLMELNLADEQELRRELGVLMEV
ncbi:PilZ domain-containing protein [Pseudomonas fulva]|nr:PilZ domain-containing protein [Pseudomonas fulva]MBF8779404.1 PilZ domain-containing protein [Pseudomonas fulva]